MTRREQFGSKSFWLIFLVYGITRVVLFFGAHQPAVYNKSFDVQIYSDWGNKIADQGLSPYSQIPIEYPPGVLPFIGGPALIDGLSDDGSPQLEYYDGFVLVMMGVDLFGFIALMLIYRRTKRITGPLLWIAGTMLLGPIIYVRLDLIPAVATIWSLERANSNGWFGAGGWLGFGAISKIYPVFLAPAILLVSTNVKRYLIGALAIPAMFAIPYLINLSDLWTSVGRYHFERGLEVETTWAALLWVAALVFDYPVVAHYSFGSVNAESAISPTLETLGLLSSVIALVGIVAYLRSRLGRNDVAGAAAGMLGTICGLLALGTVFSPQFMAWPLALGAAAWTLRGGRDLGMAIFLVLIAAGLTQLIFTYFGDFTSGRSLALLLTRNVLIFVAAVLALRSLRSGNGDPGF